MKSKLVRCFFLVAILVGSIFISGCDSVVASVLAVDAAVSYQEHAAYTDYYFNIRDNNLRREQQGLASNPIVPEKEWVAEYRLRLAYTKYYHDAIAENTKRNEPVLALKPIAPFEEWKTNEYIHMMEDMATFQQHGHKPAPTR